MLTALLALGAVLPVVFGAVGYLDLNPRKVVR